MGNTLFYLQQPEALGNVDVLFLLLNHQRPLPPHGDHSVHDGQLCHLLVEEEQSTRC